MTRATSSSSPVPTVYMHSTFRDEHGRHMLPRGLDWDMDGTSHVAYAVANQLTTMQDTVECRRALVAAHNRWCFAKDLPFKTINDMQSMRVKNRHVLVDWSAKRRVLETIRYQNIAELLASEAAAENEPNIPIQQVWINGVFIANLSPQTLDSIIVKISKLESPKLCYKRSEGMIRIERFFEGGIRNHQVWEHMLDNLIALEDVQLIDEHTLIGTVTLPDWIIGGMLTSRLYVQEQRNGDFMFLRPLMNDDAATSDRTYRLRVGEHDDKIDIVRMELARLRYLAGLEHPFDEAAVRVTASSIKLSPEELKRREQHRRNLKKRFTF
ncbi:hypothetical protein MPSEU_000863600 [Mayamaea pseudoterrestris]|nr:hypothetical protein MPSEU_000863600 [Mayamaea pseudoterrestris]